MKKWAVLAALLLSRTAQAASTAADLEEVCKQVDITATDTGNAFATVECAAYFRGLLDGAGLASALQGRGEGVPFCAPDRGITADQARRIFLKRMSEHPEFLHQPAYVEIFVGLGTAFPCPPTTK